ncbi:MULTISPECIES: hypothetical protein [unclassified Microcoleus]
MGSIQIKLPGEWNSRLYKRCPPLRTGRSYRANGICDRLFPKN